MSNNNCRTCWHTGQKKCRLLPTCSCRQMRQKLWRQFGSTRGFFRWRWHREQVSDWSGVPPRLWLSPVMSFMSPTIGELGPEFGALGGVAKDILWGFKGQFFSSVSSSTTFVKSCFGSERNVHCLEIGWKLAWVIYRHVIDIGKLGDTNLAMKMRKKCRYWKYWRY